MFRSFFRITEARRVASLRAAVFVLALGLVLPCLAAAPLQAQSASVLGVVKDSLGAPLSNVQIVASGSNRSALSDERGEFALRGLPAGTYHLDLVRIGYSSAHQVVTVAPGGGDVRVSIVMHVATVRLSSVNVTATPTGSDPLDITQATVQLGGKELQRALSTSVGQTLAKEPGMASRYNGPMAATPVIRGLTGERVLVLQDGERTGDLSSAAADHMNAVDPSSAERIEVIRGPASLLYGNNALGGVVNVISNDIPTSIPTKASGYLLGQGESATPGGVGGVGLTLPLGSQFAITARGGLRDFSETRVGGGAKQLNTNGSSQNFTVGAGFVGSRLSLGGVYRQMDFEYGLPYDSGDDHDHDHDGEEDHEAGHGHGKVRLDGVRRVGSFQGSLNTGSSALPTIKVDQSVQTYRHAEIEESGEVGTRFSLNTQTTNITARTRLGRAAGAVGVQGIFRQYQPVGEEAFTPAADNRNVAAFIFQEFPISRSADAEHAPRLQLGARYDRFTIETNPGDEADRFGAARTRNFDNMAGSIGLSVPVAEGVSVSANASRGFRAPSVEELYANGFHAAVGTFDVGNANLKAEQSTGLEAGLRAQSSRVFAQLNGYYNRIDGYITPVALATPVIVEGEEVPSVTFAGRDAVLAGVEGQVESKLVHHFVGGLMGDYTRASIRNSDDVLPYIPAGRVGASLRYDNGRISMGGDVRRVFAQNRVTGDELDVATDSYTLLDLSASWLFTLAGRQVHSVTLRVDNAFDEQYREATSRIKRFAYNPGRNIALVYKVLY
ncbi:MAG TPA: TonB-dependent receptor [Gemmatimonas sp.]|uniref:TonB-dependent receptor n=1 Tax=Gemmatimonas sp. TaxID=1962908 RepID=UPI002ED9D08D